MTADQPLGDEDMDTTDGSPPVLVAGGGTFANPPGGAADYLLFGVEGEGRTFAPSAGRGCVGDTTTDPRSGRDDRRLTFRSGLRGEARPPIFDPVGLTEGARP